jgi:hypothetical protein
MLPDTPGGTAGAIGAGAGRDGAGSPVIIRIPCV